MSGTWHIKAAANSPAIAQRIMKAASEYAALWSHRLGVMVLTRARTASFAKKRPGIYKSEAAYSDWTRRGQIDNACSRNVGARTLSSEDTDDGLKVLDGIP